VGFTIANVQVATGNSHWVVADCLVQMNPNHFYDSLRETQMEFEAINEPALLLFCQLDPKIKFGTRTELYDGANQLREAQGQWFQTDNAVICALDSSLVHLPAKIVP